MRVRDRILVKGNVEDGKKWQEQVGGLLDATAWEGAEDDPTSPYVSEDDARGKAGTAPSRSEAITNHAGGA